MRRDLVKTPSRLTTEQASSRRHFASTCRRWRCTSQTTRRGNRGMRMLPSSCAQSGRQSRAMRIQPCREQVPLEWSWSIAVLARGPRCFILCANSLEGTLNWLFRLSRHRESEPKRSLEIRARMRNRSVSEHLVMDGIEHEFEAVGHAQLVENVMQVILYRLFADEQLFTNLFVAKALRDMFHDLLFPIANQGFRLPGSVRRLRECIHHFGSHPVVEPNLSGINPLNAPDQKICGGLLKHPPACA